MKVLAVIPARGGSKGVPRKNVRLLGGLPLIGHSIRAAQASRRLARTIVSTDDPEIGEIARSLGADTPFVRPAELADDRARAIPVLQHALRSVSGQDDSAFDAVLMLQPTTPFRTGQDIDGAIELLSRTGADSVIGVVDVLGHHPARMKFLEGDRLIDPPFCEAEENQPRQELRPMYLRNGAIYLVRIPVLLSGSLKGKDCRAWVMPESRSMNIDTIADFELAEWLLATAKASAPS